jgi:phosphoribosylaminoimidazolecarboxamide formyltransferase/IMP cyclohydrolase
MTKENLVTAPVGTDLAQAQEILRNHRIEKLPIVDEKGILRGLITIKDIEKATKYPNSAKDASGRLLCGAAIGATIEEAWNAAYEADKVSIYGGIVAVNRPLTAEVAMGMKPIFLEIVMAPEFTAEALEILSTKKNLRLLKVDMTKSDKAINQYISVNGGLLVQQLDTVTKEVTEEMCVTETKPTEAQLVDMNFGWRVVKHVKSNAIAVVKDGHTLGVGAGQMNRVGSAEIALKQAQAAGFTEGLVLASDGFLPFDDTVAFAAQYGVTAIVQPGGSIRDEDSIRKANELGITMLFTGMRHFKH